MSLPVKILFGLTAAALIFRLKGKQNPLAWWTYSPTGPTQSYSHPKLGTVALRSNGEWEAYSMELGIWSKAENPDCGMAWLEMAWRERKELLRHARNG